MSMVRPFRAPLLAAVLMVCSSVYVFLWARPTRASQVAPQFSSVLDKSQPTFVNAFQPVAPFTKGRERLQIKSLGRLRRRVSVSSDGQLETLVDQNMVVGVLFIVCIAVWTLQPQLPSKDVEDNEDKGTLMLDMFERLTLPEALTQNVKLVSLGCFCGVKGTFNEIGRGAAYMPFDYIRTRLDGVLHFLRHDFDDFFQIASTEFVYLMSKNVYRSRLHSFWHEDPATLAVREKYQRRIDRLKNIDATSQEVLFVRAAAEKQETLRLPELLKELQQLFGARAHLLFIVDFQTAMNGPAVVEGYPQIMLYYHSKTDMSSYGYTQPIACALNWVVDQEHLAKSFGNFEEAFEALDARHLPVKAYNVVAFDDFGM